VSDAPIFVVGCPRSGTGLVRDLLRSHPRLSFPSESHFIPPFYRAWGDPRSDREARALARSILALRRVRAWEVELGPEVFAGCRSFAAVVDRIYGAVAEREGKARWGDKTPHYVTEIPLLLRLFPGAKVVHVYRDGRDVALSYLRAPFGPNNVYVAAGTWKRYVRAGRAAGGEAPASYTELRYEDLLRDPRATMSALCEFLGEPFSEQVLRPDLGARHMWVLRRDPDARRSLAASDSIVRANHGRWREAMDRRSRALFESVAGDQLAELGYEVEGLGRAVGRPARVRQRVDNSLRATLRTLRSPRRSAGTALDQREAVIRSALGRTRMRGPYPAGRQPQA
jgi:hypothetical protein